jgi:putative redox protein
MATVHEVSTKWVSDMQFASQIDDHIIQIDTVEAGGGHNKGPKPKALLLSALTGCTGMDVASILNKMHVQYSDFNLIAKADLTDEHPRVYSKIYLIYQIKVKTEDQEKVQKAVNLSKEKYCGVSAMLSMVCPIEFTIEYL